MEDWQIIAVVIGIVGALVGVYLRESVRKAYQQKVIATKLEAYLLEWQRDLLESEWNSIFILGYLWQNEEKKAVIIKGIKGLKAIEEKYRGKLDDLKAAIAAGEKDLRQGAMELHDRIKKMTDAEFDFQIEQIVQAEKLLLRNQHFISDDEAATLSWVCAHRVIPLRSAFLNLAMHSRHLLITLRHLKTFNLIEIAEPFYKVAESGILMSKHYMPLMKQAQQIRQQGLISMTLRNLF